MSVEGGDVGGAGDVGAGGDFGCVGAAEQSVEGDGSEGKGAGASAPTPRRYGRKGSKRRLLYGDSEDSDDAMASPFDIVSDAGIDSGFSDIDNRNAFV